MYDFKPPDTIEELYDATDGNNFAAINAPTSGAREASGPGPEPGPQAIQLYSLATPNGWKVGLLLEELEELEAGMAPYDAHVINIGKGEQFSAEFVRANPNSKIPALVDCNGPDGDEITIFESCSIMLYLAEKFGHFLPASAREKQECYNWLFWQMAGQGPMTGNYGHFMVYAPADKGEARDYGVARYGMEVQRLLSVLDQHLDGRQYMVGDSYTIADMACFPWVQTLRGKGYDRPGQPRTFDFLGVEKYTNVQRWANMIMQRPATYRGVDRSAFHANAQHPASAEFRSEMNCTHVL